jgi:urease accessory protein
LTEPGAARGWTAGLTLGFRRDGANTVLAERRHHGPLVVQKALYPEGKSVCHAIIVHAPGGIAGGDELRLDIRLEPGSRVLTTTPAATKWYKAEGREARQTTALTLGDGAVLEFLPQETILFDRARARIETVIDLTAGAVFAGWEITCLGRRASGEHFAEGRLRQGTVLRRDGRMLWNERMAFAGGDRLLRSPIGLGGHHVSGTMIVAGPPVLPLLPAALLDQCRAIQPREGECGVTALPEIVAARYRGDSAESALGYFEKLRAILRPWYAGLTSHRPRIWDT